MVEVVGQDDKYVKEISCRNCAARLRYVQSEVQSRTGRDYSGGADGREWIVCPKCHAEVTIRSW